MADIRPAGAAEPIDASRRILAAAAAGDWRGSDPYDGLWWDWPGALVGGRRRRQAVMQVHARAPVDIRVAYRKARPPIPKAQAIFAACALKLHRLTGEPRLLELAGRALTALEEDRRAGDAAWGYHWDMQTRWSFYPAGSPNVVVTAFAIDALALGAQELGPAWMLERARGAARWVLDELWRGDLRAFVYHPGSDSVIHNANLLGALGAWRVLDHEPELAERAATAVERTLAGQRDDGAWPYGAEANLGFVDSFHTGYVLRCLCELAEVHPDVDGALQRGAAYYTHHFFDERGAARLWPQRPYPEDGHSLGTALTTLALLCRRGLADVELVERVARRGLACMLDGDHAVFRRYRWGRTRVSFVRWCDAHVAQGLADAAAVLGESEPLTAGAPGHPRTA